jgi:hypothetical protein
MNKTLHTKTNYTSKLTFEIRHRTWVMVAPLQRLGDALCTHDEHLVEVRLAQPAPRRRRADRSARKPQTAIHSPPPTPRGVSPLRSRRCATSRKASEGSSNDASFRLEPLASLLRWLFGQPSPHSQLTYEAAAKKQIRRGQGAAWALVSI